MLAVNGTAQSQRVSEVQPWSERLPPVRVCFLIDELARAGTETQLLALLRGLDRRRVEPTLCLLRGDSPVSQALEPTDCHIVRLGVRALRSPATWLAVLRFARWLRQNRIDVLQTYFPDSTYFGLVAGRWAGVGHRLRTRNNLGHWVTPFHRWMNSLLGGCATRTVTNCEAARSKLIETETLSPDRVVVLNNGVDLDRFLAIPVPTGRPKNTCRIGVVANLRTVKGVDLLIDALSLLKDEFPTLVLEIAGDGEERQALVRGATSHGIGERCRFLGSISDIPEFLSHLNVAVQPSRSEGMSNALLEYMAAARPIVATRVGAAGELIDDGEQGLLVSPNNATLLAQAIARLLRDAEQARSLGLEARRRARERYSRQAMIGRFENFYQSLVYG